MPYELNVDSTSTVLDDTQSYLEANRFEVSIDNTLYPNLEFNIQSIALPDISVNPSNMQTPIRNLPTPGDTLSYGDLTIGFIVDEKMLNYKEIHNWLIRSVNSGEDIYRDITLLIKNGKGNVIQEINFNGSIPTSLSSLQFDTTATDSQYLVATATFAYAYFKLI